MRMIMIEYANDQPFTVMSNAKSWKILLQFEETNKRKPYIKWNKAWQLLADDEEILIK